MTTPSMFKTLSALALLLLLWTPPGFCADLAASRPDPVLAQVEVQRTPGQLQRQLQRQLQKQPSDQSPQHFQTQPDPAAEPEAQTIRRPGAQEDGLTIQRRDEQGDILRTTPGRFQPILPPDEQVQDGGRMLEAGWDALGLGAHEQALGFFEQALALLPPGNNRNEAALGRSYALSDLQRHEEAVVALEALLQAGYRPKEVRPALFRALMQIDQLERAEAVLAELDDNDQQELRRQEIQRIRLDRDLSAALRANRDQALLDFLHTHQAWLDQCREPYAFFQASQALREQGASGPAREVARKLLACPLRGREQGLYVPLLQSVVMGLPFDRAQREIARQRELMQGRDAALAELARLELEMLQRRIADTSPDDPEYARLAEQILRLAPDDDGLRLNMAWNCLETGNHACAEQLFREVLQRDSANISALKGRVALLERQGRRDDPEYAALVEQILRLTPEDDALRLNMAWNCLETGDHACAEQLFREVLQRDSANIPALEGLVALLERQGRTHEAISLAQGAPSSEQFLPVLTRLYRAEAARAFAAEDHLQALHWMDKHAALAPDDPEMLAMSGWALYHSGRYEQALDVFAARLEQTPDNEDALNGMVVALQALNRHEEALSLLENQQEKLSADLRAVLGALYCTLGNEKFQDGLLDQAVAHLKRCVELNPEAGAVQLLGWSLFELGDPKSAHGYFQEAFALEPDQDSAEAVLLSSRELDDKDAFWNLLRNMAAHASPQVRTAAADAYAAEELPIRAAQTHPESGRGTCYANCDAPWLDTGVRFRSVSGDDGLSRLDELSFPIQYHRPAANGGKWTVRLAPRLLSTGKAPQDAYMGSFYSYLDQGQRRQSPLDQTWVVSPEVGYQQAGRYRFQAMLGATPLGGPIHALPIFRLGLGQDNDWALELRQGSVSESLLSAIGQKDPYSGATWGRVVQSGIKAGKTFDLAGAYWLAAEAEYDHYWGENVAGNHRVAGNLSLGRTDDYRDMEFTSGLSLTAFHFQNNQNFHTFGHGGYFSPDHFVVAGPFVRLQSPRCKEYWFDLYASLGWMDYASADAPHYRKISAAPPEGMNAAARNDYQGTYPGESKSALATAINLQALKLITANWALGAMAGINTASDHAQWQAGLMLRYFFKPRSAFFSREGFVTAQ